jgi:hypothetical protein
MILALSEMNIIILCELRGFPKTNRVLGKAPYLFSLNLNYRPMFIFFTKQFCNIVIGLHKSRKPILFHHTPKFSQIIQVRQKAVRPLRLRSGPTSFFPG